MTWRRHVAGSVLMLLAVVAARAEDHAAMTSQRTDDARKSLPLTAMMAEHQKANMRDHLAAVQAVVAAIARDDMDAVTKASARIGYSEAMGRMCDTDRRAASPA